LIPLINGQKRRNERSRGFGASPGWGLRLQKWSTSHGPGPKEVQSRKRQGRKRSQKKKEADWGVGVSLIFAWTTAKWGVGGENL